MFKALFLDALQRYIGEYVKTDDRSLRVALEGGHLELRDLEVRREAFDRFGLPFAVKAGYIGLLRVELPRLAVWRSAGAASDEVITVDIESAYLLVAPRSDGRGLSLPQPRTGAEARREKQRAIAAAEQLLRSSGAGSGPRYFASAIAGSSFYTRLLTQVIDMVRVSVRNVHVRCEDEGALTGSRLNMGLILAEADFRPSPRVPDADATAATDRPAVSAGGAAAASGEGAGASGQPPPPPPPRTPSATPSTPAAAGSAAPVVQRLLKSVRLRALLLYLEPHGRQIPVEFLDVLGRGADGSAEMRTWFEQQLLPPAHAVTLRPLSASADLELCVRRAAAAAAGAGTPAAGRRAAAAAAAPMPPPPAAPPPLEVRLEMAVERVEVRLSSAQFHAVLRLLELGTNLRRWVGHWAHRPGCGWPRDGRSAREWWRYACRCVQQEERRRLRRFRVHWPALAARRALRQRYVRLVRSSFKSRAQAEEQLQCEVGAARMLPQRPPLPLPSRRPRCAALHCITLPCSASPLPLPSPQASARAPCSHC